MVGNNLKSRPLIFGKISIILEKKVKNEESNGNNTSEFWNPLHGK